MKTNNILILSEYFYPDLNATGYSMTAIAERLVKGKNNVTVITASNKSNSLSNKNFIKQAKKAKTNEIKEVKTCVEINQCVGCTSRRWRGRPGSVEQ